MRRIQPVAQSQPSQINPQERQDNGKRDIPINRYSSKLDGLDAKLLSLKLKKYSDDFKESLDQVLALYSDDQLKYSPKLVAFVMHEVERYLLKPKSGATKRALVLDCCRKYFDNNDEMVNVVIDLLFKDLKQVKYVGRQLLKVARFFLSQIQRA
jgi:hypothetical protein